MDMRLPHDIMFLIFQVCDDRTRVHLMLGNHSLYDMCYWKFLMDLVPKKPSQDWRDRLPRHEIPAIRHSILKDNDMFFTNLLLVPWFITEHHFDEYVFTVLYNLCVRHQAVKCLRVLMQWNHGTFRVSLDGMLAVDMDAHLELGEIIWLWSAPQHAGNYTRTNLALRQVSSANFHLGWLLYSSWGLHDEDAVIQGPEQERLVLYTILHSMILAASKMVANAPSRKFAQLSLVHLALQCKRNYKVGDTDETGWMLHDLFTYT